MGRQEPYPLYVGIIHVLLHRLVWGVGNQFGCMWDGLYLGFGEEVYCTSKS